MIIKGDCIEEMKKLEENSVDAIVTDPPYGLEFMGKDWDKFRMHSLKGETNQKRFENIKLPRFQKEDSNQLQTFCESWATECLRVLKPGGFLLSFGGTRTYHRMVCGIEDAGFEIRDTIMWLYGSGFPKSLNIGKQIDKMNGTEKIIGKGRAGKTALGQSSEWNKTNNPHEFNITEPNSPEAQQWEGWGTALKPAVEPIVVARKPLSEKNVALNVLKWGTGGINIDASRVGNEIIKGQKAGQGFNNVKGFGVNTKKGDEQAKEYTSEDIQGRFPANIILDEEAGRLLDEQSGYSKSTIDKKEHDGEGTSWFLKDKITKTPRYDKGGASRFFYCPKSSKSERNFGCEDLEPKQRDEGRKEGNPGGDNPRNRGVQLRTNSHPTVKPVKLMEYLIKLVSREGATILDPFLGSGTTGIASIKLNRKFIGIEKEEEYVKIAKARIKPFLEQTKLTH